MTTRRQILLYVMPLFVGLAALGSALTVWLQLAAEQKSFDTEATTAAVAMREFLPVIPTATPGTLGLAEQEACAEVFERLRRAGQLERILVFDTEGRTLVDTGHSGHAPRVDPASPLSPEGLHLGMVGPNEDGQWVRPILVDAGRGLRVGLELNAKLYRERRAAILRHAGWLAGWTLLGGLAVCGALAWLISHEFKRLGHVAGTLGESQFPDNVADTRIKEVADVGDILKVMHSVLQETLAKTRRSILDRDFGRNDRALATVFTPERSQPDDWTLAGIRGVLVRVGSPVVLHHTLTLPSGGNLAYLGLLPDAGPLQNPLRIQAAQEYLIAACRQSDWKAALQDTLATFGLRHLRVLHFDTETWTAWQQEGSKLQALDLPAATGAFLPLAELAPEDASALQVFLAAHPDSALDDVVRDLPGILPATAPGFIWMIQRH